MLGHPTFLTIAKTNNFTPEQAVYKLAQLQGITPLSGTTQVEHMRQDLNVETAEWTEDGIQREVELVKKLIEYRNDGCMKQRKYVLRDGGGGGGGASPGRRRASVQCEAPGAHCTTWLRTFIVRGLRQGRSFQSTLLTLLAKIPRTCI